MTSNSKGQPIFDFDDCLFILLQRTTCINAILTRTLSKYKFIDHNYLTIISRPYQIQESARDCVFLL